MSLKQEVQRMMKEIRKHLPSSEIIVSETLGDSDTHQIELILNKQRKDLKSCSTMSGKKHFMYLKNTKIRYTQEAFLHN